MHYIIDGYNMLFRILRKGSDLKTQRESFLAELNARVKLLELNVTLVFDAQYAAGEASRLFYDTIEVHFTDQGETADEYILKNVKRSDHPRQQTVITSDSWLAWAVRRHLAKTETVEKFISWLNKRYEAKLIKSVQERHPTLKEKLKERPVPPQKETVPLPRADPCENFAYYLHHFEKMYEQLTAPTELKPEKKRRKEKKTSPPRLPGESDFDRWFRLFQERDPQYPDDF